MKRLFVLLLLLFVAGCSVPDPFAEEAPSPPAQGAQIVLNVGGPSVPAVQEQAPVASTVHFDIVAAKYSFTPSRLDVKKGDTVEITLTSSDVKHGFGIPAFNIDENVAPGEMKTFSFVADKVGEFPFSCNVYCGSGHGDMDGVLVVTS